WREGVVDRGLERGIVRGQRRAAEDEREGRSAGARQLSFDEPRRAPGFSRLDEAAALELAALRGDVARADEKERGDDEHVPAPAVDEVTPGREQADPPVLSYAVAISRIANVDAN